MKMHIQKFITILLLMLALAAGLGVSTSAVAFASSGTSISASTQRTLISMPAAPRLHTVAKIQNASNSCAAYLVPQQQWEYYLQAVSIANPSVIYWFQGQPFYGQLDWVNVWRSTNGGRSIAFLGTFQPPVSGPGFKVFYSSNNPWIIMCGYSVSFPR